METRTEQKAVAPATESLHAPAQNEVDLTPLWDTIQAENRETERRRAEELARQRFLAD